jgi:hypothetical protein
MGPLPAVGQWVKLSVPASVLGLEGHTLAGMGFTLYGGRATWDYAGKESGGPPPPPTNNLLVNGSFEVPVLAPGTFQYNAPTPGWTFNGAALESNGSAWDAPPAVDGVQAAAIQVTSSISQTLSLNAGVYNLSFYAAQRAYQCCGQVLSVKLDGTEIGLASPPDTSFHQFNLAFSAATSGNHTLTIGGTDPVGDKTTFVDRVVLAASGGPPPPPPPPPPTPGIWVDDSAPAGATLAGDLNADAVNGETWNWITTNPTPYSGIRAHQSLIFAGEHQHYFYNATATLPVAVGESLFAYVYLDPANPPSEVMLQWQSGDPTQDAAWFRAYWGANQVPWGPDGTVHRHYMGPLPAVGQWVKLSVPASVLGLEGHTLAGMGFTLYGGRATWDYAGKSAP